MSAKETKEKILELTKRYYQEQFAQKKEYVEGERVNYAGRVFDEKEFPEFEVNANVRYVTQGNVLVSYEIIDDEMPAQTEKTETEKEI